jgi:hypothetical protein
VISDDGTRCISAYINRSTAAAAAAAAASRSISYLTLSTTSYSAAQINARKHMLTHKEEAAANGLVHLL